jgi:hypothetical protein
MRRASKWAISSAEPLVVVVVLTETRLFTDRFAGPISSVVLVCVWTELRQSVNKQFTTESVDWEKSEDYAASCNSTNSGAELTETEILWIVLTVAIEKLVV